MMERNKFYLLIAIVIIAIVAVTLFAWNFVVLGDENIVGACHSVGPSRACTQCAGTSAAAECINSGQCDDMQEFKAGQEAYDQRFQR